MSAASAYLLLRGAALVAEWMKGDKDRRAWWVALGSQLGFVLWALATGAFALLPLVALGIAVSCRNLWEWSKPEGRPYVLRLESELADAVEKYAELLRRYESRLERDGRLRHDRARYTRRLNTYAHELREAAIVFGLEYPPVPEPPSEEEGA